MEWGGVFNVARYLTDSLRGPVLQTLRRARSASLMGQIKRNGTRNGTRNRTRDGTRNGTVTESVEFVSF